MTKEVHWSYEGETGPEAWGQLDPLYATCGFGMNQSPIDIANVVPKALSEIEFHYQPTRLNIVNNGHSIQVNYDKGSYIEVDDERFHLLQFHFHTLSEHTYAGKFSELEMHLVHQSRQGRFAVVGVMFDAGVENAALKPIWNRMPAVQGPEQVFSITLNVSDLLPNNRTTYRYNGSLTTPPCSENVLWVMMATPLTLSRGQVRAFEAVCGHNNRPVQPLNGRIILTDAQ